MVNNAIVLRMQEAARGLLATTNGMQGSRLTTNQMSEALVDLENKSRIIKECADKLRREYDQDF